MVTVALEPASRWSFAELAEIFNAGYEGYFMPFKLDEAAFRFMSTTWDDDLDASRVALVDGEPVGICKVAVRGDRGWVGGHGVTVPHRGEGVGDALMRGVIEERRASASAKSGSRCSSRTSRRSACTSGSGSRTVREFEGWTLEEFVFERHEASRRLGRSSARARPRGALLARPWQRADESVTHLDAVEAMGGERGARFTAAAVAGLAAAGHRGERDTARDLSSRPPSRRRRCIG